MTLGVQGLKQMGWDVVLVVKLSYLFFWVEFELVILVIVLSINIFKQVPFLLPIFRLR